MLLAIDVGNTHSVYGLHDGETWRAVWRRATDVEDTADEIGAWLATLHGVAGVVFAADRCVVASVVPSINGALVELAQKYYGCEARMLRGDSAHGVPVTYDPPSGVGADRIANAIAALAIAPPPVVVVDFGTATTFDVVDRTGAYVGGAILAGPLTALESLIGRTAKLPSTELKLPEAAIGRNTTEALRSGTMFGYAGAIDALAERIDVELGGGATFIATGGLSHAFQDLSRYLERIEPMLTLDGLRLFADRAG